MEREEQDRRPGGAARYDRESLRKVTALAQQLQRRHEETLTAEEIEAAGAEVGLQPPFIRQALALLDRRTLPRKKGHALRERRSPAPMIIPAAWTLLSLWVHAAIGQSPGNAGGMLLVFMFMAAPFPLAGLSGYLSGKRIEGFLSGAALFVGLFIALLAGVPPGAMGPDAFSMMVLFLCGISALGATGVMGAALREHLSSETPRPQQREVSRGEMLRLLGSLRAELAPSATPEEWRDAALLPGRAAFLTVDVVDAVEHRCEATPEEVEAAFESFRAWAGEVTRSHRGSMERSGGDAVLCVFPEETDALLAARRLVEGLYWFNAERHRLPRPVQLRCGLTAGEVNLPPHAAFGYLQSPLHARSVALRVRARPGEVVMDEAISAAALREFGRLERVSSPAEPDPAYAWRAT